MKSEQAKNELDKTLREAQDDLLAAFDVYQERVKSAAERAVENGIDDGDLMAVATGRAAVLQAEINRRS